MKLSFDKRHFRWFKQRRQRGFDDRDLWNLDTTMARFILPRLKAFRECYGGCPSEFLDENDKGIHEGMKRWEKIQNEIIEVFEILVRDDMKEQFENQTKIDKGLRLFGKYFQHYWN